MTDHNRMSRRDWFRLRPHNQSPGRESSHAETLVGPAAPGLQALDHPPNHHGMDLAELPPMREAQLTDEQVRHLFADIGAVGSDVLLMQRTTSERRAAVRRAKTAEQLQHTLELLLAGTHPRVQVRYRWQGTDWIDTLERQRGGVRLVRIAHRPPASSPHTAAGTKHS